MASTGIINNAMTDPNAPQSATEASASSVGAQPDAATQPTGNTITNAPTSATSPNSTAAGYLDQLNSGASAPPVANSAPTQSVTSAPTSVVPQSTGIVNSAMTPKASQKDSTNTGTDAATANNSQPSTPLTTPTSSATPNTSTSDYSKVVPTSAQDSALSQLYQSDLGRAPDAAGEAYWANAMNNGVTLAQVDQSMKGSSEYASDHSGVPTVIPTTASTYTPTLLGAPTQLNVAPNQTVQGQLQNIMDPNSPIMMQARTGALQQANANGLLNSSMAITAGDNAAYAAAIPIANSDAGIYNNAATTNANAANNFAVNNQTASNTAGQFNAGAANTLTGQQLSNQTALTNAQLAAQTSVATNAASNAQSGTNAQTQAQSAQQVAQINATNTSNINASKNVSDAASTYQNALLNIENMNMSAQSKYAAESAAYNAYVQQVQTLSASSGVPDVSNLLQFNMVDPATGVVDPLGANGLNTLNNSNSGNAPATGIINSAQQKP
jgi:hypothetical protein